MLTRLSHYVAVRRQARLVLRSGLLDVEWYLGRYADVAASGLDPVTHFVRHGGRERRDPNPMFDSAAYLAQHPEIDASGLNPLVHYLVHGSGRRQRRPLVRRGWLTRPHAVPATDLSSHRHAEVAHYWALVAAPHLRPGSLVRIHQQTDDGRVAEIVLDRIAARRGHVVRLDSKARLSALADGAEVTVREMPQDEAVLRLLLAHGRRQGPEHLRALRRRGIAAWLDAQAVGRQPVGLDDYQIWALRYDTPNAGQLARLEARACKLRRPPKFSVIVPVYDTEPEVLHAMIASVRRQAYPHWQLCIADDASPRPHVRQILEGAAAEDARIVVVFRTENGHIAAASNTAIERAEGDWLALLDHDDVLAPQALATMALAIAANPETDLLYSDEDKLDANHRRYGAYFKPDFNPELLEAQNFLNHLTVYRAGLVNALGGFRLGFEGSQDHDLALRVVAATRHKIVHVPHVLYHWRLHPGVATFSSTQLDRANAAARRALQDYAAARGEKVEVVADHTHRIIRADPPRWPRVTAIVPTRDHLDVLRVCIDGLLDATDYPALDIIIVDNESERPETLAWLEAVARRGVAVLRYPGPFNYSAINNFAAKRAQGEILVLLNSDIAVVEPGWLKQMVRHAMQPGIGAVGAKLLYPDGRVQHAGVVLGIGGVAGHVYKDAASDDPGYFGRLCTPQEVGCVTAACMAVPAAAFAAVGGFDAKYLAVAFNDVDLCLRLRASGRRVIWTPHALLEHWESRSRGSDQTPERQARFNAEIAIMRARWPRALARDPFFSPNFSLDLWPHLASPPRTAPPWTELGAA